MSSAASPTTTPRALLQMLREKQLTLAVAESCTGGLLMAKLSSAPGASAVFRGGIVAYSNEVKRKLLGVAAAILEGDGAVSRNCAVAMAEGARLRLGADVAVAVTGIAGPGGAVPGKPVGTVWIAVAGPAGTAARRHKFSGGRAAVRNAAVRQALAQLRAAVA